MTNLSKLDSDSNLKCSFKGCTTKATVRHRAYGDLPFCDEHAKVFEKARVGALAMNTKSLKENKGRS